MDRKSKIISLIAAVAVVIFTFMSWQVSASSRQEYNGVILATQATARPTATQIVLDPLKTPVEWNAEVFLYDALEVLFRGGSVTSSCPYRWVSVRDQPSIYGNVVGCLTPKSIWNIEKPYVYEGINVWGCLAMQVDNGTCHKWIALKYAGVYFTNWHEK